MTNLEWLKTLSAEELADWFYDEWLHHLQYRWSSSRGGLIIWLNDRKTEPTISKMEQVDKDINVRSKTEQITSKLTDIENSAVSGCKSTMSQPKSKLKDEPQTDCAWRRDDDVETD